MFRSWGEFHNCATDVFHLFAELPRDTTQDGPSSSHQARGNGKESATEVGLSRAGMECAFYVLFGRYPSRSLLDDCFVAASTSNRAQRPSNASTRLQSAMNIGPMNVHGKRSDPSNTPTPRFRSTSGDGRVLLSAFLRFITVCAEEEGPGLVTSPPQQHPAMADETHGSSSSSSNNTALPLQSEVSKAAKLQCWRLFESVAGTKGFITVADVSSIPMQHPFQDVDAVLESPSLSRSPSSANRHPPCKESADSVQRRQKALAQHVFWIVDRDHDGKVRFDDVKPYLLGSA